LPRKTDSHNPADWLLLADSEVEALQLLTRREIGYSMCRSKLAEVLEKLMKAELIRLGWFLEKTHDLEKLLGELQVRKSDLVPKLEPLCDELAEAYFTGRYPGFDLDEPDWPVLRDKLEQVSTLLATVRSRLPGSAAT
jgi:HEPN domain-containing protein